MPPALTIGTGDSGLGSPFCVDLPRIRSDLSGSSAESGIQYPFPFADSTITSAFSVSSFFTSARSFAFCWISSRSATILATACSTAFLASDTSIRSSSAASACCLDASSAASAPACACFAAVSDVLADCSERPAIKADSCACVAIFSTAILSCAAASASSCTWSASLCTASKLFPASEAAVFASPAAVSAPVPISSAFLTASLTVSIARRNNSSASGVSNGSGFDLVLTCKEIRRIVCPLVESVRYNHA